MPERDYLFMKLETEIPSVFMSKVKTKSCTFLVSYSRLPHMAFIDTVLSLGQIYNIHLDNLKPAVAQS